MIAAAEALGDAPPVERGETVAAGLALGQEPRTLLAGAGGRRLEQILGRNGDPLDVPVDQPGHLGGLGMDHAGDGARGGRARRSVDGHASSQQVGEAVVAPPGHPVAVGLGDAVRLDRLIVVELPPTCWKRLLDLEQARDEAEVMGSVGPDEDHALVLHYRLGQQDLSPRLRLTIRLTRRCLVAASRPGSEAVQRRHRSGQQGPPRGEDDTEAALPKRSWRPKWLAMRQKAHTRDPVGRDAAALPHIDRWPGDRPGEGLQVEGGRGQSR